MATTTTPNFGMTLPDDDEPLDELVFNANLSIIDTLARAIQCTSVTTPSSPFPGQVIYETDTALVRIRNNANSSWTTVAGLVRTLTAGTRPASPSPGQLHYESDTNSLVVRSATSSWQYPSVPIVPTTSTIVTPITDMVVYDQSVPGFRKRSGASWDLFDANCLHKYKPTTESVTSSTTLQNDDVFFWNSLPANSAWELESFLPYDGIGDVTAAAGGLKCTFSAPALASMYFVNYGTNPNGATQYDVVVNGLGGFRAMPSNGGTIMSARLSGVLVMGSNAGTLQFQWAQNGSSATATRILGSAWMKLTRIG